MAKTGEDTDLRDALDRMEIVELAARLSNALDTKDWPGIERCYVPDALGEFGGSVGTAQGAPAIAAVIRRTLQHLDASQHLVGTHVVTLDGDEAEHSCYVQAQHVLKETAGGDLYIVAGTYHDRLRRTPDGWRLTYRRLDRSWSDGNRDVLHPPAGS